MRIKSYIVLIVGILLLIISILSKSLIPTKESVMDSMADFTHINTDGEKSYLYIDFVSFGKDNLFVVYKGDEEYVVKVSDKLVDKMGTTEFDGDRYKLVGISREFDSQTNNDLIAMHNEKYEYSTESQVNEETVNNLYGRYFLEVNKIEDDVSIGMRARDFRTLVIDISIVLIAAGVILFINEKKGF